MSLNSDYFLSKALGDDFGDVIKSEIYRPGTRQVSDIQDIFIGMKIVPKAIMSFLIRELSGITIGDHKDIDLPMAPETVLRIDKTEFDSFNGVVEKNHKKIVEFIGRSIPGIGIILMSTLELYDVSDLEKPETCDAMTAEKVQKLIDDRLALQNMVAGVVDQKLAQRDAVERMVLAKLTEAMKQPNVPKVPSAEVELAKVNAELEQTRVQLAGCSVAAMGGAHGSNDAKPGMYGHSASFDDVKRLREDHDRMKEQISNVTKIAKAPGNAHADEYMRGMANGLEVADCIAQDRESEFVEPTKLQVAEAEVEAAKDDVVKAAKMVAPTSEDCLLAPALKELQMKEKGYAKLKNFLEKRKQPKEHFVEMTKGESFCCPDCGEQLAGPAKVQACICYGENAGSKVFFHKTENGIKLGFGSDWTPENIQMLLETLRRRHG